MPDEMGNKWIIKFRECFELAPEKYLRMIKKALDDYEYSVNIEKSPSLIIPYFLYTYIVGSIDECYVKFMTDRKKAKYEKWKKKREEDKKYYANLRLKEKYKKTGDIIGDLYK